MLRHLSNLFEAGSINNKLYDGKSISYESENNNYIEAVLVSVKKKGNLFKRRHLIAEENKPLADINAWVDANFK